MKRPLVFLIALCAAAALAGWGLAYWQHRARVECAAAAAAAEARKPGDHFAGLVRQADAAEIVYEDFLGGRFEVRVDDPAWLARLADVLQATTYEATTGHLLMVSYPAITIYRQQVQTLFLMHLGKVLLRGHSEKYAGDFIVGPQTGEAIRRLVLELKPDAPTGTTSGSTATPADSEPVPVSVPVKP